MTLPETLPTEYDQLMQVLRSRRSVRRFRPDAIDSDTVDKLLEAARWAPSASNRQAFRFAIIDSRDLLDQMAAAVRAETQRLRAAVRDDHREQAGTYFEAFVHFGKAPLVLAPFHRARSAAMAATGLAGEAERAALCSVSAAIMNVLLAAHALGLGACWMTGPLVAREALERLLGLPEGWTLSALIPVGYPAETPAPPPRQPLSRLAHHPTRKAP